MKIVDSVNKWTILCIIGLCTGFQQNNLLARGKRNQQEERLSEVSVDIDIWEMRNNGRNINKKAIERKVGCGGLVFDGLGRVEEENYKKVRGFTKQM